MRYVVHAPVAGKAPPLGAALTPTMTRPYGAWSSRGRVFGQPGTMPVPAPNSPLPSRECASAQATNGVFSTLHAPQLWFPSIYFENDEPQHKEKFPASVFSDDQLPVPALRPVNVYIQNTFKTRKGGQRQVYQPQVVPTWRGMRGTTNG